MTAPALIEVAADPFAAMRAMNRMRTAGFSLRLAGGSLQIAPADRLTEQQRAFIRAHKPALAALLMDASELHAALVQAARERLVQAVQADASDDEISRLSGELSQLRSGQSGNAPLLRRLDLAQLENANLSPKCIVENYLYADVALVAGAGGTGKTTTLLYEAVQIALGRPVWGCRVVTPGATLFVTAEDSIEVLGARLREIMVALNLSRSDRELVLRSIPMVDLTVDMQRLAELDSKGNIILTRLADSMVQSYQNEGLVQVIFDPVVSFGPGERLVNDGEQAVITASRRIRKGLNCCVRLNHHTGKANARNGALDQYAVRGGSALPDGSRMVTILSSVDENGHCAAIKPSGFDLRPDESGFILARAKLSYAPPALPNIWIRRRGFAFDYVIETRQGGDEARELDARKVADFLFDELQHGRKYTPNTLEQCGKIKFSRARLRTALATLEVSGRLTECPLQPEERQGGRKTYLRVNLAERSGGLAASGDGFSTPTSPALTTSPPYREKENGEVYRRFSFSPSLTSPANSGEVAAKWRSGGDSGEPLDPNCPDSPLAQRILATLASQPGGFDRADLARIVGNGKGASAAMIDTEVNRLLLARRIATANGKLVLEVRP